METGGIIRRAEMRLVTHLLQVSVGCAEEADRVLLGRGHGDRREQSVAVRERRRTVDGHGAGDLEPDLAEVVDVSRRLRRENTQIKINSKDSEMERARETEKKVDAS